MIKLVSYSDHRMTRAQDLCVSSSLKYGVDEAFKEDAGSLDPAFTANNYDTLTAERGAGYWLWKPYVINKHIQGLSDGDILIYADAGIEFVNSVKHITDRMDEDIFFFTNGFKQVHWCKRDVWAAINCGVSDTWQQVQASVILFKVNQRTKDFVKEWLLWCQMPGFIDDSPSKKQNHPEFAEHRHDQAILTCLQIKHGYKLHFWPTNYSEHIRHTAQPEDNYPTIFNHHRKRNDEW